MQKRIIIGPHLPPLQQMNLCWHTATHMNLCVSLAVSCGIVAVEVLTDATWFAKPKTVFTTWLFTRKTCQPDLDHAMGPALHRPLPLSPGTQLVLEEAFPADCGHGDGSAFFLQERNTHSLERQKRVGTRPAGTVL